MPEQLGSSGPPDVSLPAELAKLAYTRNFLLRAYHAGDVDAATYHRLQAQLEALRVQLREQEGSSPAGLVLVERGPAPAAWILLAASLLVPVSLLVLAFPHFYSG